MDRVREQIGFSENLLCTLSNIPITIAFLDTGIGNHPDFGNRIVGFKDFVNHRKANYDDSGHGTHVCGIAGGDGGLSQGRYKGINPTCRFVVGKVLDENGDSSADNMIEGIRWVISQRDKYQIRILNISIGVGTLRDKEKKNELVKMVEQAWYHGITVVCSAGNMGPEKSTISPLGISSLVITVGCHDGEFFPEKGGRCEDYLGRGPTEYSIKKPDIVAPGTKIVSYDMGKNKYVAKSGTSMATPLVSAALSLLYRKEPFLNNEDAKKKLLYAAVDLKEPWTKQGWGMLNIKRLLD